MQKDMGELIQADGGNWEEDVTVESLRKPRVKEWMLWDQDEMLA